MNTDSQSHTSYRAFSICRWYFRV